MPASVDSIPTSAEKEDHVSMGGWAARKALQIVMVSIVCKQTSNLLRMPKWFLPQKCSLPAKQSTF